MAGLTVFAGLLLRLSCDTFTPPSTLLLISINTLASISQLAKAIINDHHEQLGIEVKMVAGHGLRINCYQSSVSLLRRRKSTKLDRDRMIFL